MIPSAFLFTPQAFDPSRVEGFFLMQEASGERILIDPNPVSRIPYPKSQIGIRTGPNLPFESRFVGNLP